MAYSAPSCVGPGAATIPFDLHGYLVIHNVLGAAEVAERIRFGSAAGLHGPDHGFLNWGEPFCRLLDHEAILLCQGWIGPRQDRSGLRTGVMLPTIRLVR